MCRASLFYFYITLYKIWRVKYIYICKKNPLICSYLFRLYDKEQSYVLKLGRSRAFIFTFSWQSAFFFKSLYRDFICHLIWLLSTPPHHKKIKKQISKKKTKPKNKKNPPPQTNSDRNQHFLTTPTWFILIKEKIEAQILR